MSDFFCKYKLNSGTLLASRLLITRHVFVGNPVYCIIKVNKIMAKVNGGSGRYVVLIPLFQMEYIRYKIITLSYNQHICQFVCCTVGEGHTHSQS
jgi:hypothetical protein